jgi:hypothetical protein
VAKLWWPAAATFEKPLDAGIDEAIVSISIMATGSLTIVQRRLLVAMTSTGFLIDQSDSATRPIECTVAVTRPSS